MTMPGYQTYSPPAPPERKGLAVASLALGIIGLPALALCGAGMVVALVGFVLGVVSAVRGQSRTLALAGIVCSAATLVIGGVAIFFLLNKAAECADRNKYPDDTARRQCVEREFPFANSASTP